VDRSPPVVNPRLQAGTMTKRWNPEGHPYNPWATTGSKGPGILENINRTLTHSIWKHKHSVNTEVRKDFKVSVITESTSRLY
jgi:hypothetical protein